MYVGGRPHYGRPPVTYVAGWGAPHRPLIRAALRYVHSGSGRTTSSLRLITHGQIAVHFLCMYIVCSVEYILVIFCHSTTTPERITPYP